MLRIEINGQVANVEAGSTVIQAAENLDIFVPRYCYHPGLSIAGSCRMCLVEIERMPKLAISCHTQAQDGMKVTTDSEKVRQARKSMLEFLLVNHPLDCPVCDQSGECDLQNYYMEIGQYDSRFLENKLKKRKALPIGPHVILDQERCILCTRCTRFCEEVSKSNELGVFHRGNRSVVDLAPQKTLDNPYSGNVIDICPVGALTEREFRFQCRVWYLSTQESICNGCARGCNISIHYNTSRPYKAGGKRVQRLKPRFNPFVNRWWICDEGRFGYEFIDHNRIEFPYLRVTGGDLEVSDWKRVVQEVSTALKTTLEKFGAESIGVIASPQLSNEELYLIQKLFGELMGIEQIGYQNPWEKEGLQDDFLMHGDKNPNSRGAQELGLKFEVRNILEGAASGKIKVLYIFQHNFESREAQELLKGADYVIFQGTNWNKTVEFSNLVLPGTTHAEEDGTFTNFEGRLQRYQQAFLPLAESKAGVEILTGLAQKLGYPLPYLGAEDVYMEWSGSSYGELEEFGKLIEEHP